MVLKGVDYKDLSHRLAVLGVNQSAANLRSKVNHGTLGAQLFVFIQFALGVNELAIEDIQQLYADVDADLRLKQVEGIGQESKLVDITPPQLSVENA